MSDMTDATNSQAGYIWRLAITVILLNLFLYGLTGMTLYQSRVKYQREAAVSTQNLARVLDHYIDGEIDSIDIALLAVKHEAEAQLAKGRIDKEALNRYITQQHSYLPQLKGIRITDAKGDVRYGTDVSTLGVIVNFADRDDFIFERDNPKGDLFISNPVFGRITKQWIIHVTRRINYPDGSFAGIVYGALSIDHFVSIFSGIDVGNKGSILLRNGENALVARYPEIPNTIGTKTVSKEFTERIKKGIIDDTFMTRAVIETSERLISYRKISKYPLYVFVTRAVDEYLTDWRKELLTQLGLLALFTVATIFSSWLLLIRWKREKQVETELRMAKEDLEQRVAARTEELNQTNEQLTHELVLIESLLQNSPAGIRVFDAESGQCVLANQSAAAIAGGTPETLLGQNFRELESWKVSGLLALAEQVLSDGVPRSTETVLHTSFDKVVPVTYQFSRFNVRDRLNLLVIGRDISDEKRLSDEKKRIEEQMLHAQKLESMGVLAGGIAHDFNNILTAIIGNADLALMRLNPESPVLENLQKIEKAAGRAADLAKQMLAYSGKGKFVIESIDINRLVEEMLHMLEVSISKKVVLRLNLYRPLPTVEADATQLRQIIMNLVINASEAIGEKSGIIAITTGCMECDQNYLKNVWLNENLVDGLYIFLEIADTGCGMDKETMVKIFDPFFTTKFTGRGLGMAAVLGIVRGHKGAIKVYSEPGKGSSFKILLPAGSKPEEIFNTGLDNDSWQGAGTVLLVDDEETIRALGSEMLRELGFQVVTAEDGRHALKVFTERDDINLVILDLTMPHMDGEQTFRELRHLRPDIKVIMSSGYNEQEVTQKFVGKGLAGFIQKPYKLSMIREVVRNIL